MPINAKRMNILSKPSELAAITKNVVFAAGFFDGVHIGHRKLIQEAKAIALQSGAELWVLSFEPHPLFVVKPEFCPKLITPLNLRLELLEACGVDGCLLLPFTKELAQTSPEAFCEQCFSYWYNEGMHCTIVSGPNWRFGHNQSASIRDVEGLTRNQVSAHIVEGVEYNSELVSSSRIRQALLGGDLQNANAMLGYYYTICKKSIPERGVGTKIGFPTANIIFSGELMPPNGVYVTRVTLPREAIPENSKNTFFAVANLGFRPTFPNARPDAPVLELHLLDFDLPISLHGLELYVEYIKFIRWERKFDSPEELVRQIKEDIIKAREAAASLSDK